MLEGDVECDGFVEQRDQLRDVTDHLPYRTAGEGVKQLSITSEFTLRRWLQSGYEIQ